MIIKLIPNQIPVFWEAIKFASTKADEVDNKDLQPYLNELLQSLLSSKAQCFVSLDNNRTLTGLLITRLCINKITGNNFLLLQSVYTWKILSNKEWEETYSLFKSFAEKENCKYLLFTSRNPSIWDRTELLGFKESTRAFTLNIS